MIRLARWDVAASTYASSTAGARGDRTIDRLSAPVRGPGFWIAMWALAVAAEFGALVPIIFPATPRSRRAGRVPPGRRLVRGLRSGRLAPAAGQPQRPADGRRRLRLLRLGCWPVRRPVALTAASPCRTSGRRSSSRWCSRSSPAAGCVPGRPAPRRRRSSSRCSSWTSSRCCSPSRTATCCPRSRATTSPTRSTRPSARWPASPASAVAS